MGSEQIIIEKYGKKTEPQGVEGLAGGQKESLNTLLSSQEPYFIDHHGKKLTYSTLFLFMGGTLLMMSEPHLPESYKHLSKYGIDIINISLLPGGLFYLAGLYKFRREEEDEKIK